MHLPWKNRYSDKETLLAETGRLDSGVLCTCGSLGSEAKLGS